MWEILGDLAMALSEQPVRAARVRRVRRRMAAGLPARIPVSARSERPGWPAEYLPGSLLFAPGTPTVVFTTRQHPRLEFLAGGELDTADRETWYEGEWARTDYQAPGGGPRVQLQVHWQYLPVLRIALRT